MQSYHGLAFVQRSLHKWLPRLLLRRSAESNCRRLTSERRRSRLSFVVCLCDSVSMRWLCDVPSCKGPWQEGGVSDHIVSPHPGLDWGSSPWASASTNGAQLVCRGCVLMQPRPQAAGCRPAAREHGYLRHKCRSAHLEATKHTLQDYKTPAKGHTPQATSQTTAHCT